MSKDARGWNERTLVIARSGVRLQLEEGKSYSEIARDWKVSRATIYKWEKSTVLHSKPRGGARHHPLALSETESKEIKHILYNNMPSAFGLSFRLWSLQAVQQLIVHKFGRLLTLYKVRRVVIGLGLSFFSTPPQGWGKTKIHRGIYNVKSSTCAAYAIQTKRQMYFVDGVKLPDGNVVLYALSPQRHIHFKFVKHSEIANVQAIKTFVETLRSIAKKNILVVVSNIVDKNRLIKWRMPKKSIGRIFLVNL